MIISPAVLGAALLAAALGGAVLRRGHQPPHRMVLTLRDGQEVEVEAPQSTAAMNLLSSAVGTAQETLKAQQEGRTIDPCFAWEPDLELKLDALLGFLSDEQLRRDNAAATEQPDAPASAPVPETLEAILQELSDMRADAQKLSDRLKALTTTALPAAIAAQAAAAATAQDAALKAALADAETEHAAEIAELSGDVDTLETAITGKPPAIDDADKAPEPDPAPPVAPQPVGAPTANPDGTSTTTLTNGATTTVAADGVTVVSTTPATIPTATATAAG